MPQDRWEALKPTDRLRISMERDVVTKLVEHALEAGYQLSVDDGGEELAIEKSNDKTAILDALLNTDEDRLIYHPTKDSQRRGWVYLVYGNDGYDVICDYTTSLESHIRPVLNFCDQLEKKAGRP